MLALACVRLWKIGATSGFSFFQSTGYLCRTAELHYRLVRSDAQWAKGESLKQKNPAWWPKVHHAGTAMDFDFD
jgi:hypothetical protein